MAGDELRPRRRSPTDVVDEFFDRASDGELDELIRKARERVTPEDLEMWDGDETDFFPLPDEESFGLEWTPAGAGLNVEVTCNIDETLVNKLHWKATASGRFEPPGDESGNRPDGSGQMILAA